MSNEPLAICCFTSVEDVYGYEPIPAPESEEAKHVLGAQGNVWTEYIRTPEKVEYMAYPRATVSNTGQTLKKWYSFGLAYSIILNGSTTESQLRPTTK